MIHSLPRPEKGSSSFRFILIKGPNSKYYNDYWRKFFDSESRQRQLYEDPKLEAGNLREQEAWEDPEDPSHHMPDLLQDSLHPKQKR